MKRRKPTLPNHRYVRGVLVFLLMALLVAVIGWLTYGRDDVNRDITKVTNISVSELNEKPAESNANDYELVSSLDELGDYIGDQVYLVGTMLAGGSKLSVTDGQVEITYDQGAGRLNNDIGTAYLLLVETVSGDRVRLIRQIDSVAYMAASTEYGFHSRFLTSEIISCLPDYKIYRAASVSASKNEIESVIFRSQLSHSSKVMSDFTYDLVQPKLKQSIVQDNAASYCRQPDTQTEQQPEEAPPVEENDTIEEDDLPVEWFAGSDNLLPVDALDID